LKFLRPFCGIKKFKNFPSLPETCQFCSFLRFSIPKELKSFENFVRFLKENLKEEPLRVKRILSPCGKLKIEKETTDSISWEKISGSVL